MLIGSTGEFYILALHIIFMVSWFAGLFYLVRLFVYHAEAGKKEEPARTILSTQFALMEMKLYLGIAWPAGLLTIAFGSWLTLLRGSWNFPWFWVKMALVLLLFLYHLKCGKVMKQMREGKNRRTSGHFRLWNEVATFYLFSIIFTVIFKGQWIHTIAGVLGLFGFLILFALIVLKLRSRKRKHSS